MERFKVVVRGFIEMILSLVITRALGWQWENYAWLYCSSLYTLAAIRSVYLEKFDIFATIFLVSYII